MGSSAPCQLWQASHSMETTTVNGWHSGISIADISGHHIYVNKFPKIRIVTKFLTSGFW